MASVFLSYDREDIDRARPVVAALEKAGHSVWWDRHIKGGAEYNEQIEQALKSADAVLVLWSARSVKSAWVRDEAAAGRDSGRLVPVALDGVEPPLGFRQFQTIDLKRGSGSRAGMRNLLDAIDALGGSSGRPAQSATVSMPAPRRRRFLIAGLLLVVAAMAVLFVWRPWRASSGVPIVAVAAGGPERSSEGWARDLLVQLGQLQAAKTETVKLIDAPEKSGEADLIFEVDATSAPERHQANLTLIAGKDRSLLWSRDFEAKGEQATDLKQRLALNAARVLGCALEGMAEDRKHLPEQTFKLYLSGCAQFADVASFRSNAVVPIFLKVTEQAPKFRPGWAKLLVAEANTLIYSEADRPSPEALRKHIEAARRAAPGLPEAELAEMALTPPGAFARRMDLIDSAIAKDPNNPWLLSARGLQQMIVGRLNDAVADARKTVELDPLSPATVNGYISVLAYSGRKEAAFAELRRAEQAWPGSTVLLDARYRLLVRFGNPQEALNFARSEPIQRQGRSSQEAFLTARLRPTEQNIELAIANAKGAVEANPRALRVLVQTLAEFGREQDIYDLLMRPGSNDPSHFITDTFFRPALRKFRSDPRFMRVAARFGLIRYWRESGRWPDFCFEPGLPYDCKRLASRLAT